MKNMFLPIVLLLALTAVPALAGGGNDQGGNNNDQGGRVRGAPGPLVGAGFPVFSLAAASIGLSAGEKGQHRLTAIPAPASARSAGAAHPQALALVRHERLKTPPPEADKAFDLRQQHVTPYDLGSWVCQLHEGKLQALIDGHLAHLPGLSGSKSLIHRQPHDLNVASGLTLEPGDALARPPHALDGARRRRCRAGRKSPAPRASGLPGQ